MKGKLPKYVEEAFDLKAETVKLRGLSSKVSGEYKLDNEVKLKGSLLGKYEYKKFEDVMESREYKL